MIPPSSLKWQQYRALLELLPEQHPEYPNVLSQFRRQDAGQAGENRLEFYLQQAQLSNLTFLKRLRIEHHHPFQIDWIVLTSSFRVIFEVKNFTGPIYFDAKSNQLTREIDGTTKAFDDPVLQVDRQYINLRAFLIAHDKKQLPIYRYAVFVNPNVILKLHDYPDYHRILTGQAVPNLLEKLAAKHPTTTSDPVPLKSFLEENHQERLIPILEKHQILWENLIQGIPCPNCSNRPMLRERMCWQCLNCGERSADAHKAMLYSLALLSGNQTTKNLAAHFLLMDSPDAARKMLGRAGYIKIGANKTAYYAHPELLEITKSVQ
ncbi:Nuclease-related domain-containing protein [Gracilibacillus kekensis]|uniref:Nuclease-related domain-containing protein n=1 Tax=Gracilibacillus kekensis TaxID=1027249 RepID=A0A1M7KF57_9BACI|nr:Nuclease-related domain-containing protein [Gracilibacillus kekensis]